MSKLRLRFSSTITAVLCFASLPALADTVFSPGNLILSRSVYTGTAASVTIGQPLPPNCPSTTAKCPAGGATNDGTYPGVFDNAAFDGSFGVTSPIFLDQITTGGVLLNTFNVPVNVLTTSFSSKSELALNLSTDRSVVTFMGYNALPNSLDISNSNTPGVIDPTNPVGSVAYRVIAQLDASGNLTATNTNAYSGNNGRAAIYAAESGFYYAVGNNNNGAGTDPSLTTSTGVEIVPPGVTLATPRQIGDFSITQYGYAADKAGKDNNFRGLTIFGNTIYVTKGSGGNGINTVYQVGSGALPTLANAAATPITILPGFPTTLAKNAGAQNPFGLFFADSNTLYVADEGDGTVATAATSPNAGLQKWVFDGKTWNRVYVLQNGLHLGQSYAIAGYPAPLSPATAGLRNITGRVNADGTVTIWAVTSTVSASGDQGADPNKLVTITDVLANTSAASAASESFEELRTAQFGEVLRGISFTPGTPAPSAPAALPVFGSGLIYSRLTQTDNGTVSVRNNTSSNVAGPISITFAGLPGAVSLLSDTRLNGLPAVQVLAAGASLAPGQVATIPVSFSNSGHVAITYTAVATQQ